MIILLPIAQKIFARSLAKTLMTYAALILTCDGYADTTDVGYDSDPLITARVYDQF
jgi:hypothetical protein